MTPRDLTLAVAVAAAWGFNFVVIAVGLDHFPPLLFSALRFGLAAFPAVLFVGRPRVRWRWVLAVGLLLGVVKFSLLFVGIEAGMPAGLSSLVLQSQAIFTLLFAMVLLGERPGRRQLTGTALATAGIALVAWQIGPDRPPGAFALVIGAAVAWGLSNVAIRRSTTGAAGRPENGPADMLRFMVWVSAVATLPLFGLSLLIEGPAADLAAVRAIDPFAISVLVFIACVSTLAGFGVWGALIHRYSASTVAPFSMLVPFFGMASTALLLDEPVSATDVIGGVMVMGGVLLAAMRGRVQSGPTDRTVISGAPVTVPDRV